MVELPPEVVKILARLVRDLLDCTQEEMAERARVDPTSVYRAEHGHTKSLQGTVEKLCAAVPLPMSLVKACLLPAIEAAVGAQAPFTDKDFENLESAAAALDRALSGLGSSALASFLATLASADDEPWERTGPPVEADRLFQAEAWERLEPCSYDELIFLIDNCPEYQTWYVVEKLCHESEEAASDHVGRALELAKAALRAAERMPGEKAWQSQAVSYALVFLSNCPRVQGEVNEAEPTFGRARELWQAGAGAHPGLLAEWRFLDLEGSLLRDQRRFPEALERLDSALACAPREATGRILIKKAFTLEQKGENEEAIAALREAAPRVREQGDPRQLFALWFNWTANLCTLGRYTQADRLLRRVRELAAGLRKGLHDLRVRWLGALVDAGLGRVEEAISALEEVRKGFEARGMVYDSALAAVKLAELYLEQGPAAETRELAVWMEEVFRERGIEREAWAALGLFCEAARQEGATAEWARRLFDYLQRARHDPALPFAG